jgi:intracellular sulfur oxidation DsrE/DsrF family protein
VRLTRKELLATGAAALVPAACAKPPDKDGTLPGGFAFDQGAFQRILAIPVRHRQCVASARIASGLALYSMVNTMYAYEYDLHEGPGSVHCVGVFYHVEGAVLGLNDRVWNELLFPAYPHLSSTMQSNLRDTNDAPPAANHGNPWLHRHPGLALEDDPSIEALVLRGCHFFVCDKALQELAKTLAQALVHTAGTGKSPIYHQLLGGVVPGAMVVPAGVMAINACQEAHFTYLQAAL